MPTEKNRGVNFRRDWVGVCWGSIGRTEAGNRLNVGTLSVESGRENASCSTGVPQRQHLLAK